ncbi:MAG: hypothetical protein UCO54_00525 [Segatella copri]|nr:hypothetical protein [Segatella copri]
MVQKIPESLFQAKRFWDLLCLIVCHDVLPFAYRYGCVGLRIWLRGVKNMTALG